METPGELADKIGIVEIRIKKHPDRAIQAELTGYWQVLKMELQILEARVRKGSVHLDDIARPLFKLRARIPKEPKGKDVAELTAELAAVNQKLWDVEDLRDKLVTHGSVNCGLLDADIQEQQLNQDRSALIDAINTAATLEWGPKRA